MIRLYHGSNIEITEIDLSVCKNGKDSGKGFYLNPNFEQAKEMAQRTVRILQSDSEIVNAFDFNNSIISNPGDIKIKIFDDYSEQWADFVVKNRKNTSDKSIHDFDIVIGPIADDSVGVQIRRYIQGYLSASMLVKELRFHGKHAIQYFFGTKRAINLLTKINL